jgi:MFS family permease
MFMLAPDVDDRRSGLTLAAGALAIAVALIGGLIAIAFAAESNPVLAMAAMMGLVSAALYGCDVAAIYRSRERRRLELNMRMATLAFASLAATGLLGIALAATQTFTAHLGAFVFLAVFGWLSGLILAKLYKIVAFLTWLETYGPVMGRAQTPRVQDLVAEQRAAKWFIIYYVSVWAGTITLLAEQGTLFRVTAAAMTIGVIGIVREIIRIRRLAEVARPLRLPGGAVAPHLLFARN